DQPWPQQRFSPAENIVSFLRWLENAPGKGCYGDARRVVATLGQSVRDCRPGEHPKTARRWLNAHPQGHVERSRWVISVVLRNSYWDAQRIVQRVKRHVRLRDPGPVLFSDRRLGGTLARGCFGRTRMRAPQQVVCVACVLPFAALPQVYDDTLARHSCVAQVGAARRALFREPDAPKH